MKLDDGSFFGIKAPVAELFGLKPQAMSDDAVSAILPHSPNNLNAHGTVSGPAITALLDFTLAAAVRAHAPLEYRVATLDLAVKFLRPGIAELIAECHCESRGNRVCFASGVVYDHEVHKIAIANGSFILIKA
jgi:uncharacterized protein (TIGR00369 family)